MSQVTTHVLDLASGRPAAGVAVVLERLPEAGDGAGAGAETVATARTDGDGRVGALGPEVLRAGVYRLRFDTGAFHGGSGFYPEVAISFRVTGGADGGGHYHVPLLLGPWGYTTYRGS
jgi:5-hydroxyisourate hydrolase